MDKLLLEKLEKYCPQVCPMHMPGHKRNTDTADYLKKLAADIDITEIDGFDNLHSPEGVLLESMNRAAKVWGSRKTFYLVGGSTCGIMAAVFAAANWGDKIIMARNCHKSVYNAVNLRQLKPVYLKPKMLENGICGEITPESAEKAFEENPDAKVLFITSPTYEGIVSDIGALSEIAHRYGAAVIVDEAHGAHLGFGYGFPDSAVKCGADIVVQSLHKTMPSLTQTALLHVCSGRIDCTCVQNQLSVFQTSSPSYLLMSSIDGCVSELEKNAPELFSRWQQALDIFYCKCKALEKLKIFTCAQRDRSKIVVLTANAGMSGTELMKKLRCEYKIELEMASVCYAVAMTGMGDTLYSLDMLADALIDIDRKASGNKFAGSAVMPAVIPEISMFPWQTQSAGGEYAELVSAPGRTSLEYVWAYPPGIPLLVPGEVISRDIVNMLLSYKAGGIELKSTQGNVPDKIFVLKMQ